MVQNSRPWTKEEDRLVTIMMETDSLRSVAGKLDRTLDAVKSRRKRLSSYPQQRSKVMESPFPQYNVPLEMEGDALVLPDVELPFHDADFLNRCLELAQSWGITKCIVAGDLLHFDSLSAWSANMVLDGGTIGDEQLVILQEFANQLPEEYQLELQDILADLEVGEAGDPNLSQELRIARREITVLSELFDEIHLVLGNHEMRMVTRLKTSLFPDDILRLLETGDNWKTAPYFYSILYSGNEKYQIEHPKSASRGGAAQLAAKFQCNILQAHSHIWNLDHDISGNYWAAHIGCVVDESRLPYASQRHGSGSAHKLGACIVRDGYPYMLCERTQWDRMKRL